MRSKHQNLYSLYEWIDLLGHFNPWFVSQYYYKDASANEPILAYPRDNGKCNYPWFEEIYVNIDLSRQDVNRAIVQAENLFERWIGYSIAPKYYVGVEYEYPQIDAKHVNPIDTTYLITCETAKTSKTIKLRHGYLQQVGTEILTHIGDYDVIRAETVTDGLADRFTGTIPFADLPTDTTTSEVIFFFKDADRFSHPLKEWQIRHVFINEDSGTGDFDFYGDSYLLTKPEKVLGYYPLGLDAAVAANYVTQISAYRVTTDTDNQGIAIWSEDCSNPAQNICFSAGLQRDGYLKPDKIEINSEWVSFDSYVRNNGYPDKIQANYLAGYSRQDDGRVDYTHAEIIAYLSAALLSCEACDCGCGKDGKSLSWYSQPFVYETQLLAFPATIQDMNRASRFGTQNGAVMAWDLSVQFDIKNIGIAF